MSVTTDSCRGLRTQLNEKELEVMRLHVKALKWKQRCQAAEARADQQTTQLKQCEELCKSLRDRGLAQAQAIRAFEERRKGNEHFRVMSSKSSTQKDQLKVLQAEIEAMEIAQAKVLRENALLKAPLEDTESALRQAVTRLLAIHKDVAELNQVLAVYRSPCALSVTSLMTTLFSRSSDPDPKIPVLTRLSRHIQEIEKEVQDLRQSIATLTEARRPVS